MTDRQQKPHARALLSGLTRGTLYGLLLAVLGFAAPIGLALVQEKVGFELIAGFGQVGWIFCIVLPPMGLAMGFATGMTHGYARVMDDHSRKEADRTNAEATEWDVDDFETIAG